MAHVARINELAENLVTGITGYGRDEPRFRQILTETSKGLRSSSYARTNQFEVKSKLDGLVEKFSVLNRDDLAEGLQMRLDELPTRSKWLPEVLSLLLLLADRPTEKTKLDDLEALAKSPDDQPLLTWREIFGDKSPDESGLWDDIDRGYHSSADEAAADGDDETTSTHATSVEEEDHGALARRYVVQADDHAVDDIEKAHARQNEQSENLLTSELMIIRESLSMLHGLPTTLYNIDSSTGVVSPYKKFVLDSATRQVVKDMLNYCATMGSSLNTLRHWLQIEQSEHYLQSCQAVIQLLFSLLGSHLSALEKKYILQPMNAIVSFIYVRSEVELLARPLLHLSRLVRKSRERSSSSPFALLDMLFEETCAAQLSGDLELSTTLGRVLIAGLRTYLIPVSTWMRTGLLASLDQTFFVVEAQKDCEPGKIWSDRFAMHAPPGRPLPIPVFLRHLADQIFALGKSRAFLTALNDTYEEDNNEINHVLPDMTSLERLLSSGSLIQFSQTLNDTLNTWIFNIGSNCTVTLRKTLVEEHGLLRTFRGLVDFFCSKDGRLFQVFADTLFWRMDSGKSWRDRFMLTELAQTTLGSSPSLDAKTLSIRLVDEYEPRMSNSSITHLEDLKLEMEFPWRIQNVTRSQSPVSYSKVFTLLLQVYRAKYLLRCQVLGLHNLAQQSRLSSRRLGIALKVRQALLAMVDVFHNHITCTVSILSAALHQDMEAAMEMDTMARIWAEHEKQMETSLLLTQNLKALHDTITGLLQLCEEFCSVWTGFVEEVGFGGGREGDGGINDKTTGQPSATRSSQQMLLALQKELEDSLSFLTPGLRATSRAGGNAALEALADRLEWCIPKS